MAMVIGTSVAPRRNFTRVPNNVIDDESIPGQARWVYTALCRFAVGQHLDEPTLMRRTDLARGALRRALSVLESLSLITRRQQRRGRGFGDVMVYLGDPPLPMDEPVSVDREPVNSPELGKHGVSAGGTVDREPVDTSLYLQDKYEEQDGGAGDRNARETPAAPTARDAPRGRTTMANSKRNAPIPGQRSLLVQAVTDGPVPEAPPARRGHPVVAAWIDYCTANQVRLPRQIVGQYARGIASALADGFDEGMVKRVLAQMLADGVANRPSLLPNRLVAAQTGPEVRRVAVVKTKLVEVNGAMLNGRDLDNMRRMERMAALDAADDARLALEA
jgi:hypothetical protein